MSGPTCSKLGEKMLKAHREWIRASQKLRDLRDEVNYDRAHGSISSTPRLEKERREREIKAAKATTGVLQARFDGLMKRYRRSCR